MANSNPSKATRFKPGNCANPKGAAAHNPQVKALRRLTEEQLIEIANVIVQGNVEQLRAISKDPNASVLKTWIASIAAKGIASGDIGILETLLTRLIGSPRRDITEPEQASIPRVQVRITIPSNGRESPGTKYTELG